MTKLTRNMETNPAGYYLGLSLTNEELDARSTALSSWLRAYGRQNVSRAREVSRELHEVKAVLVARSAHQLSPDESANNG